MDETKAVKKFSIVGRLLCWLVPLATQAQPYGLDQRPAFGAFNAGKLPPVAPTFSGSWSAVVAFPNLTFLNPMGLLPMPGTTNLVVWEREGRIYHFVNAPGTSTKTLMLDISPQCQGWDDSGLMGIAFHPGFATNRFVFVYYTYVAPGTVLGSANGRPPTDTANRDRLERYTLDTNGVVIPGSVTIFIDQRSETVWHNGGGMFFHPGNGFLYLTNGDDARGQNNQRINTSLHSGILRLDVDQRGGSISHPIPKQPLPAGSFSANYYIPNDNPFVGQPGVLEEFFAIGLRSPHRMTIDPPTGRIFIGDVGDGSWEELDIIEPTDPFGLNFQWNRIEGKHGNLTQPYLGVDRPPALDYPHSEGAAIIGGYVYRGTEFAADLGGKYIFGDNIANVVWMLDESISPPVKQLLCTIPRGSGPNAGNDYVGLSSFGLDHNHELFMCQLSSLGGYIYKLQRGGPAAPEMPRLLSETGVFTNLASLTPVPGLLSYDVNSPLWSDGANKLRWMGIPDGTKIGFATNGEWTFPAGSTWVKHFALPVSDSDPLLLRRLETRILVRDTNGYVYGGSYRWRSNNTDADLIEGAVSENVAITVPRPVGTLVSLDIGNPVAGATTDLGDGYQITAGGADIWGTSDQFRYAQEQRSGDFDVAVKVVSVAPTDLYTKAGLMVRDSLAANARHILALVFPSNAARNNNDGGYEFQSRDTTGGNASALYPPLPQPRVNYPDTWLRLRRSGDTFTAYSSADGDSWLLYATKILALPNTVYLGLALTAHSGSGITSTAEFRFRQTRSQLWSYPSRQDCLSCHSRASGGVLGLNTRQSNGSHLFPQTGTNDNQLRAWNHVGYFNPLLEEASLPGLSKLVNVTNANASLESRVRSYLDANCSHCHRPGGVNANWDARAETPLGLANIIGGLVNNDLGIPGARNVAAQDVSRSVMHRRMSTATESYRMPPLAKNVVDQPAISVLVDWIQSLAPPPNVTLTSPVNGALYYLPGPIPLSANASSSNGSIVSVEYYAGPTRIGGSTNAPFLFSWAVPTNGSYNLSAFATDSAGQTGSSLPVNVLVVGSNTTGLLAEYFDNQNFTGNKLTRIDSTVDFDWGGGSPAPEIGPDTFSARWTGRIRPQFSQTYTFWVTADDGVRLYVGGQLIIDRWIDQAPTTYSATKALQAGQLYDVRLEFYENGGGAVSRLEWSSPSQARQVVPSIRLLPPNQAPTLLLVSPAPGAILTERSVLALQMDASDPDGQVAKVEFFADGIQLGERTAPPFTWNWLMPTIGLHNLQTRATDNSGAVSTINFALTLVPFRLNLPPGLTPDGKLTLQLEAPDSQSYRIESSTNLLSWVPVVNLTTTNGHAEIKIDPGSKAQFFRATPAP